jgi:hypothetical protein
MTFDDFQKIRNELDRFRKKGNKIIPLSATNLVKTIGVGKKSEYKTQTRTKKEKEEVVFRW